MLKDIVLLVMTIIILSMTITMVTGCKTTETKPDKFEHIRRDK